MQIEELVSKWNFDVDNASLDKLEARIERIKNAVGDGLLKARKKTLTTSDRSDILKDSLGQGYGKITGILGELGGMAAKTAVAFAGMAVPLVGFFHTIGEFEQTEIAFDTLIGDTKLAQKTLGDLKDFAKNTPFNFLQVSELSKQLLAVSFEANELIPTMRTLGDISSGVGKDKLPFLVHALSQVKTLGHLNGRELLQFTNAGVPLVAELAKSLGKSKEEVQGLITGGEVSFDTVMKALNGMTGAGGRFFNLMEKQSHSLLGLWSNLVDTFQLLLVDLGKTGLLDRAKNYLVGLLNWVNGNQRKIIATMKDFADILISGLEHIIAFGSNVFAILGNVAGALGGAKNAVELLFKAIAIIAAARVLFLVGSLVTTIYELAVAFRTAGMAAAIMQAEALAIPLAIGAALLAISYLIEDIVYYSQGKKSLLGQLLGNADGFGAGLTKLFEPLKKGAEDLGIWIGKKIVDGIAYVSNPENLKKLGASITEFIKDAFLTMVNLGELPLMIGYSIAKGIIEGLIAGLRTQFPKFAAFMGISGTGTNDESIWEKVSNAAGNIAAMIPQGAGQGSMFVPGGIGPSFAGGGQVYNVAPTINVSVGSNLSPSKAANAVQAGTDNALSKVLKDAQAVYTRK